MSIECVKRQGGTGDAFRLSQGYCTILTVAHTEEFGLVPTEYFPVPTCLVQSVLPMCVYFVCHIMYVRIVAAAEEEPSP